MPEIKLDAVDAAELAEILQFLSQWLAQDPSRLGDPGAPAGRRYSLVRHPCGQ